MRIPSALLVVASAAGLSLSACQSSKTTGASSPEASAAAAPEPIENLHRVTTRIWSGAQPHPQDFRTIHDLGVRTVISVDGAVPDLVDAHQAGLRYIHIPIGYDGITPEAAATLKAALESTDEPVYIHCHHGKHRAAGAAATIAVNLGWLTPAQAIARMRVAGTSDAYPGLYACAGSAEPLDAGTLDSVPADFPEASMPTGIVAGMVEIDQIMEHLKAIEAAGWRTPTDHPDLVPAAEAARLADLFRVIGMSDEAAAYDAEFAARLTSDGALATTLESTLVGGRAGTGDLAAILSDQHARLAASCTDCHAAYRD
ncbi:MAG: hypothetical protein KDA05_00560 [Phycisphaerales bacterium]|nr:hypothetical protein [Phycisphaerales bacterium]